VRGEGGAEEREVMDEGGCGGIFIHVVKGPAVFYSGGKCSQKGDVLEGSCSSKDNLCVYILCAKGLRMEEQHPKFLKASLSEQIGTNLRDSKRQKNRKQNLKRLPGRGRQVG